MKQSEIDFCERWLELRGADGLVLWRVIEDFHLADVVRRNDGPVCYRVEGAAVRDDEALYELSPRGADLVASYEAAVAQGLEIMADENRETLRMLTEHVPRAIAALRIDCPDCVAGRIPVPGLPSLVAVDPEAEVVMTMTCPKCSGTQVVSREADFLPVFGGGVVINEALPDATISGGWQPLTPELAGQLEGEVIDVRLDRGGAVLGRMRAGSFSRLGLAVEPSRSTPLLVSIIGYEIRLVNHWVTEPEAMRELLREGVEVEARWSEKSIGCVNLARITGHPWAGGLTEFALRHEFGDGSGGPMAVRLPGERTTSWEATVLTAVRRVVP